MMELFWTPEATQDRDEIYDYIEADNPAAALALDELFAEKAGRLVDHPGLGRPGRVAGNADMLKERIEAQVFQPRRPQSLQFSKEFTSFFEQRGKGIRIDAMKEVRGVTQSQTVQEIAAKLKVLISATSRLDRPTDHRAHKPMER